MLLMNLRPAEYTFQRYLLAKRSVDDRALNHHVWEALQQQLAARTSSGDGLTILEIGGGIGTMVNRLLEDGCLAATHYHLIDEQADNIDTAYQRLQHYASSHPPSDRPQFDVLPTHQLALTSGTGTTGTGRAFDLSLYSSDLYDFLANAGSLAAIDVVLAHAFMDLVDIPSTLPRLTATLRPGTLLYFTINFDGATIFEPTIDPAFDALIEQLYHRTMDERITHGKPSGDSHTGRHLFHQLQTANIQTLAAGSSDWVVIPHRGVYHRGVYPHDEAYFLHFIIDTLYGALCNQPELEARRFRQWIDKRHAQIERGELVYIAHQLDYLGELQAGSNSGASIATSRPST
jgi:hypothetical protein